MKKLAIIGASIHQEPLIQKAKSMGIETHVFAWKAGDIGERSADFFYPISITEKEQILEQCKKIGIDGICSIGSDLAMVAVNYVADAMHLTGNSLETMQVSTNKHLMRQVFDEHNDPSPRSIMIEKASDVEAAGLKYPIIIKPTDRSGSRGIMKLKTPEGLDEAIRCAAKQSFEKKALAEEFAEGLEYSVECISWQGEHHFLAMTKKYTTGAPHFIETGHLQPAEVGPEALACVKAVTNHALCSLGIKNGASHTEIKIDSDGVIRIIEIGGRMGGDFIGSRLVELSTGVDFLRAVIDVALGTVPDLSSKGTGGTAAVRFVLSKEDLCVFEDLKKTHPEYIVEYDIGDVTGEVTDSSTRFGYYIMRASTAEQLAFYLPKEKA